ncbi:PadR family transcriptional regulator [Herbiconiux daphne]|uniref:PadR family transcriptional regulator n=1 Tax=Herbiconiux daphne TaxID=2970914 RepID=A0ABT2H1I9_9MICO|nr:PadR family transcriptional regulator [Herbiconiux daphne]MCS5733818.1 PadR family transcriptional regulator [Herbiconiux daphne]
MPAAAARRSPLALVVLTLLAERPMHPYGMLQTMKQRQKTSIVNINQRNSLYQVIDRLVRDGLAAVDTTERAENRPERTLYRITDEGRAAAEQWVEQLLASAKPEYPSFPVALSLAMIVSPSRVVEALKARLTALADQRAETRASLADADAMTLPRLFVLDDEYRDAMLDAEMAWMSALVTRLQSGELTWSEEWIAGVAARFAQPEAPETATPPHQPR